MAQKSEALDRLWHGNKRDGTHTAESVYPLHVGMRLYQETHPKVMLQRIQNTPYLDLYKNSKALSPLKQAKHYAELFIETLSGWRPGEFKNYKLIKNY